MRPSARPSPWPVSGNAASSTPCSARSAADPPELAVRRRPGAGVGADGHRALGGRRARTGPARRRGRPAAAALAEPGPAAHPDQHLPRRSRRAGGGVREAGFEARPGLAPPRTCSSRGVAGRGCPASARGGSPSRTRRRPWSSAALRAAAGRARPRRVRGPGGQGHRTGLLWSGDDGLRGGRGRATRSAPGWSARPSGSACDVRCWPRMRARPAVARPVRRGSWSTRRARASARHAARPELLWRRPATTCRALARAAGGDPRAARRLAAPGGRLVYSVCTFPARRPTRPCRAFLAARPDFAPAEIAGPDGPAERDRLWPHRHGTDAMFVAAFTGAPDRSARSGA